MNRSNSSPIVKPPKFSSSILRSLLRRRRRRSRRRRIGGLLVKAGEGPLVGLEVGGVDVEPGDGALPLEGQALLRGEAAGHLRAGVGVAADAGGLGISGGLAGLPNLGGVGDVFLEHGSGVGNGRDGSKSSGGSGTEEGAARVGFGVEGRGGGLGNLSGGKGGGRAGKECEESKLHDCISYWQMQIWLLLLIAIPARIPCHVPWPALKYSGLIVIKILQ